MDSGAHHSTCGSPEHSRSEGLYRTTIAGPGRSLEEAFARLETSSGVERLLRHPRRDVLCARVALSPDEGEGYWELTRIRKDLYIILSNFKYHEARHEIVPGDGLVQFNFKVSGDIGRTLLLRRTIRGCHLTAAGVGAGVSMPPNPVMQSAL